MAGPDFAFVCLKRSLIALVLFSASTAAAGSDAAKDHVDFERDVAPILKKNCIACHNSAKSAKGDLVLETPASIAKGGESGPAIVPRKSAESLLIKVLNGKAETAMPPKKNKVGAVPLKSEEIAILQHWVDQGAAASVASIPSSPLVWRPLPSSWNPIFAAAVSPNGQYAACARSNQIFVYHVPSGQQVALLRDPAISSVENPAADRDVVETLTFSPDGTLLASGGFRSAKLWRRQNWGQQLSLETGIVQALAASADGKFVASASGSSIKLWDAGSGKLLKECSGHTGDVKALKFSPDSARLCSGSADKSLRIWTVSGEAQGKIDTPAAVLCVTWLGDGKRVVSGGADNLIRVWQLPEKPDDAITQVKEIKGHSGPVNALETIWADGKQILSGSADGSAQVWDIEGGNSKSKLNHGGAVLAVAVRNDGKRFAVAGSNKTATLWKSDGSQIATMKGDRRAQESVDELERTLAFMKDEVTFFKAAQQSAEKQQKADAEALKKATDAKTAAETAVKPKKEAATKAATEKTAGVATYAEPIAAIKKAAEVKESTEKAAAQAATEAKSARDKVSQAKTAAGQANDAKQAADKATAGLSQKAKPNEVKAAKEKADAASAAFTKAEAGKTAAEQVVVAAEAKVKTAEEAKAAAVKSQNETVEKNKDAESKFKALEKTAMEADQAFHQAEFALSVANQTFDRNQDAVKKSDAAFATAKSDVARFEAQQKQAEVALEAAKKMAADSEKSITVVAFSPNGNVLATAGEDALVHTWSVETGAPGEVLTGHKSAIAALVFLADNRPVSGGGDANSMIWTGNAEWKLERVIGSGDEASPLSDRVLALDFSPDEKWLVTGGGVPSRAGELKIWDTASGALVREIKDAHSDTVFGVSFSADGARLASCGADKLIRLFDTATGKLLKTLEGHTHHVLSVSWRRDGRTIASSGADKVIKVWDLLTGEQKKTIDGYKKEVTSVHFLDGKAEFLISSGDSNIRILKEDGGQVRSFKGGNEYVQSADITPDGKVVVAGGQDGVLRVWDGQGKSLRNFDPPKVEKPKSVK